MHLLLDGCLPALAGRPPAPRIHSDGPSWQRPLHPVGPQTVAKVRRRMLFLLPANQSWATLEHCWISLFPSSCSSTLESSLLLTAGIAPPKCIRQKKPPFGLCEENRQKVRPTKIATTVLIGGPVEILP